MSFVHSFAVTPPDRFDDLPWTDVRVEESADNVTFATVEVLDIATGPVDPQGLDTDPTEPLRRRITTDAATLAFGYFRAVWIDAAGNFSPPSESVLSPAVDDDDYPSLDSLIAASSGEAREALDALDPEALVALRHEAIDAIEAYCHQTFTPEGTEGSPVTRLVDGSGTDVLDLPKRLAVLSAVSLNGHLFAEGDVGLIDNARISLTSPIGGSWLTRVRRTPGDPGPVWDTGRENVEITGVWGWPADEWEGALSAVATAIRFDMEDQALADAHKLSATVRSARALGIEALSQGSLSMSLSAGQPGLSVRVQRKLVGFRWVGRVGALA